MIAWSRRRTLLAGLAIIALTNAIALGGVIYNRSGQPDSVLDLTQREAPQHYSGISGRENSGMALTLRWRVIGEQRENIYSYSNYDAPVWLDEAKLRELGFDVEKLHAASRRQFNYERQLPRDALIVLELDGAAYQSSLRRIRENAARQEELRLANPGKSEFERRAKDANDLVHTEELKESRLFAIDAGTDAAQLRAKFPDRTRYVIVRGRVRAAISGTTKEAKAVGYVTKLDVGEINVPKLWRAVFRETKDAYMLEPSFPYQVKVAFGRRLEPWILTAARSGAQ